MKRLRRMTDRPTTAQLMEWIAEKIDDCASDNPLLPPLDHYSQNDGPTETELQEEYQVWLDDRITDFKDMIYFHEIAVRLLESWMEESKREGGDCPWG